MYPDAKTLNLAAILLIQSGKAVSKVGRTVAPGDPALFLRTLRNTEHVTLCT